MKIRPSQIHTHLLISILGALVLIFMIQVAQAQTSINAPQIAKTENDQSQSNLQTIQTNLPSKNLGQRVLDNFSLSYYQQFLGPTMAGRYQETYNPFQEGRAPLQSFHAFNLRYAINNDWAIGSSISVVNGYTERVETDLGTNTPEPFWFNARVYVQTPVIKLPFASIASTLSYEAPTSTISIDNEMRYGIVVAENIMFNIPSPSFSAGILAQYYQAYYRRNVLPAPFPEAEGGVPTPLQTVIVSGGPYASYRFNDKWMTSALLAFDWDQRGRQTGTTRFGNNLDHRARLSLTYFPFIKYLSSVGIFTQGLLAFKPETTALGLEFSVRF